MLQKEKDRSKHRLCKRAFSVPVGINHKLFLFWNEYLHITIKYLKWVLTHYDKPIDNKKKLVQVAFKTKHF